MKNHLAEREGRQGARRQLPLEAPEVAVGGEEPDADELHGAREEPVQATGSFV
jgi:hypothetical protein